mgnify:CR=1 FL=1
MMDDSEICDLIYHAAARLGNAARIGMRCDADDRPDLFLTIEHELEGIQRLLNGKEVKQLCTV